MTTTFDEHERAHWSGRAVAYQDSFAALCAHPAPALLDAAHVGTAANGPTAAGAAGPGPTAAGAAGTGHTAAGAAGTGPSTAAAAGTGPSAAGATETGPTATGTRPVAAAAAGTGPTAAGAAGTGPPGIGAAGTRVRVLDVGTGTGTVAALAGSRGASVVAVDADPGMVELARSRIGDVRVAALPSLPFEDGEFDAAVANFVINHVGSPLAAVAEMRRVVRRGGRVAVTVWPFPAPTAQRLWSEIFDAAGVPRSGDLPRLEPADDFARTPDGLSELLTRAGLTEVRATSIDWIHRTDPEAWWSGPANGLGTPGLVMLRQPPATIARIRQQFGQLTAPYLDADGRLALPTSAVLGVGVA